MSRGIKQERSIPVQSRIRLDDLAELATYWETEGFDISNMSKLVSWSISLLREVLAGNGKLPVQVRELADARRMLIERGLYKGEKDSMGRRGFRKLGTSISFESMRNEGVDPAQVVPRQYKMLHKGSSVEPFDGRVSTKGFDMEKAVEIFENIPADRESILKDLHGSVEDKKTDESRQHDAANLGNVDESNDIANVDNSECTLKEGSVDDLSKFEENEKKKLEEEKKAMDKWLREQSGK